MNIPKPAQYILNFLLGYCYVALATFCAAFVLGIVLALFEEKFVQPFTGIALFLGILFMAYTIVKKASFYITKTK